MMDKATILERLQPMTYLELLQMRYEMKKYNSDKDWVEVIDQIVLGKYWNHTNRVDTGLCVHPNLSTKHFVPKDHGCKYHSKIEELRKDNDSN